MSGASSSKRRKTEKRSGKSSSQTTFKNSTRTKEDEEMAQLHIAYFFYENGIPFNAVRSKSFKKIIEAIGEFGPRFTPPNAHELQKYCDKNNDANLKAAGGSYNGRFQHIIGLFVSQIVMAIREMLPPS